MLAARVAGASNLVGGSRPTPQRRVDCRLSFSGTQGMLERLNIHSMDSILAPLEALAPPGAPGLAGRPAPVDGTSSSILSLGVTG